MVGVRLVVVVVVMILAAVMLIGFVVSLLIIVLLMVVLLVVSDSFTDVCYFFLVVLAFMCPRSVTYQEEETKRSARLKLHNAPSRGALGVVKSDDGN